MNEKSNEFKEASQLYKELPKDAQMFFSTLMNLALILFKSTKESQEPQKGA